MSDERDAWSYSERYATPPPEPPPPPPATSGSMTGPVLALIGVGLLVAAVVAGLLLRGPTAPAVTTATATPGATVTPVASRATPDADDLALQRFWTLIADPKLSYHLETTGGGLIGSTAYTFRESLDVSGDDWKGSEQAHGSGYVSGAQLVVLDTVVWLKVPGGTWHKNIEHDPYFRSRPLLDLGSDRDLALTGTVVKGGKTLYDLKSTTNYQPYPGRLIGFISMGIRVDTLDLDILVTDQGVPVQATVHILAGGLDEKGKPVVDAKATRMFTKVGATFTITAPKP